MNAWSDSDRPDQFNSLMEKLRSRLKSLATSYSKKNANPRYDSSDVTQNSLLQLIKKQLQESTIQEFSQSYLRQIVSGHAAKLYHHHDAAKRTTQREQTLGTENALFEQRPFEVAEQKELAVQIFQALDALNSLERHVVLENVCYGVAMSEIALDIKSTDDIVRGARNRGLRKMRQTMQRSGYSRETIN